MGLSIERRRALVTALQARALRSHGVTPCDARVFEALAMGFYNGRSGACWPGFRAIAKAAGVSLGTVSNATRRLLAGGWISWRRTLRYVHGQLRWAREYEIAGAEPDLRSSLAPKPTVIKKRAWERPMSRGQQLAALGLPDDPAPAMALLQARREAWREHVRHHCQRRPLVDLGAM
jgi:hypothetical protein